MGLLENIWKDCYIEESLWWIYCDIPNKLVAQQSRIDSAVIRWLYWVEFREEKEKKVQEM